MQTTWRVERVTATRSGTIAELGQVEWFKPNPEYQDRIDEVPSGDFPEEFIDAAPGEEGAECAEIEGRLSLDIRGFLDLAPDDNVTITIAAAS